MFTLYSNVIELCSMVFVFAPSDTCCDNCAVSDINISSSGFCIAKIKDYDFVKNCIKYSKNFYGTYWGLQLGQRLE